MSMVRKLQRSIRRKTDRGRMTNLETLSGSIRAGMHQKTEHAFLQGEGSPMVMGTEITKDPEENDLPADIDGDEALNEAGAEAIAETAAEIAPDPEILKEITDPAA